MRYQSRHARLAATLCCVATLYAAPNVGLPLETVTDSATGMVFPATVTFTDHRTEHTLAITGLAVRRKFFLDVYCIAHYTEDTPTGTLQGVLRAILADESAKQVTMVFLRDVSAHRIQSTLMEGFEKNSTESELEKIRPFIHEFARSIHKDVKRNDQFIIRWLPGGRTISLFEGREVNRITNVTFAKVLWSIWFGEQSVVDRTQLISFLTKAS